MTRQTIGRILAQTRVIPVLQVEQAADAIPLAEALVSGGLRVLEVTLRTRAALEVIHAMKNVPGVIVGAGTVLNGRDLDMAIMAGAQFIVSPGLTHKLASLAKEREVPFLPGVASASDIMRGLEHGFDHFKFFPAEAAGGLPALKALSAPFAGVKFCPTGGIKLETAPSWLAEPSVVCVGGSWLVPKGPLDPVAVYEAAAQAAALG